MYLGQGYHIKLSFTFTSTHCTPIQEPHYKYHLQMKTEVNLKMLINPLTPGHFAKKCLSKRVKPFLGRHLAEKNPNCPKRCLQVEHWTSFCS